MAYALSGETVVLGGMISNYKTPPLTNQYFEEQWNLPWRSGSYHRTTFSLNPNADCGNLDAGKLAPAYSQKALHLENVEAAL